MYFVLVDLLLCYEKKTFRIAMVKVHANFSITSLHTYIYVYVYERDEIGVAVQCWLSV